MAKCSICGADLKLTKKFCTNCGEKVPSVWTRIIHVVGIGGGAGGIGIVAGGIGFFVLVGGLHVYANADDNGVLKAGIIIISFFVGSTTEELGTAKNPFDWSTWEKQIATAPQLPNEGDSGDGKRSEADNEYKVLRQLRGEEEAGRKFLRQMRQSQLIKV